MRAQIWLLVATSLLVAVAGATAVWVARQPEPGVAAVPVLDPAPAVGIDAAKVLHDWDALRAAAYTRGDAGALRRLYARDSIAGRRDVRLLRSYEARGLRIEGLTTQLIRVRAVEGTERDELLVWVTDRIVGAVAVGNGSRTRLPASNPRTRLITLVHHGGGWVVAEVRARRAG